jgi:cyclopropane-fatty-acyl-phospholipid synthase
MMTRDELRSLGTSPTAIEHHYDLPQDFFRIWLGPEMVYSCALWDEHDPPGDLDRAQLRKLDFFAESLRIGDGRVLDIGCGWGALLDRFVSTGGAVGGVGITLSPSQVRFAIDRRVPGVDFRLQSWIDHEPDDLYDVITCIEATEHLASDAATADEKVDVYRTFFGHCAEWLRDGGRVGLQLICLDNVGHAGSRAGRGPLSELIRTDIFPESMPASLSEMILGWETHFRLDRFRDHSSQYRRTFRSWGLAARARHNEVVDLIGDENARLFSRYFAAGEACFRLREHALYRVVLTKRPQPKKWTMMLRPSAVAGAADNGTSDRVERGASAAAAQSHYDLSNEFYALMLGPTMMYSSAMWDGLSADVDLESAHWQKVDFFARHLLAGRGDRVLDVGCGWGGNLRRLRNHCGVEHGVGLTISAAQEAFIADDPIPGVEIRLESWTRHETDAPYDAIFSYGAFEHFAHDGTTGIERVDTYRQFFAKCFEWLRPDGRVALETIGHDDALDTSTPLGRGPLGDVVLGVYPESICPHLSELVLGFEPYFEVEVLRADAMDFARTMRGWSVALRAQQPRAAALVGTEVVRRWLTYLAASEVQFRLGAINNYRVVLRRRPSIKT